ncbi:hypothetical protein B0T14DRAFT_497239 [Immersiella caudata]|uniref:Uncharacterized protein n=1 Tax=Immersiella caudata TaxID=314043 RepID=A0AA39WSI0_9PEZI|nr:hypothetical protein B0T14DRAFT_497239 [Immersiella caudata]
MELQTALRRITEQEDYIFTLSNRLLAAEKECKEIERSISQAAEHRQDLAVQETLRYECSVLRDQNIKMTSQRQVISLAAKGSLGPTGRNIREDFELILAGLKDACSSLDIIIPAAASDAKNVSREATAELWSQRLTGSNLYELGSRVSMDEISGVQFMSALAAVAIAELVFESDFPDFLARESPLLDQYREHILQKAGPQTLADLDLLAYHSILSDAEEDDDSYFHSHLLANTARSLSSKMVHAIASLISSGTEPPHNSATSDTFVEPILQALKLKANLTLTRKRYAVVFPQPGDAFDPTTMIPDGESQRQMPPPGQFAVNSKAKTVQSRVKLCLFPGLRVYAKRDEEEDEGWSFRGKQSGVGANVRSCLVRCNNFEKNPGRGHGFEEVRELEDIGDVYEVEGRARASMTGYVPLVRAVVLA